MSETRKRAQKSANITSKQTKFLLIYLAAPSLREACEQADIAENTGRAWLRLPHLFAEYERLCQEQFGVLKSSIMAYAPKAVKRLLSIVENDEASEMAQIRASQILLDHAHKAGGESELAELRLRLAALEARPDEA